MIADRIEALLADKGYDADAIREYLAAADIEAVIPAKSNRRNPVPHDREKYRCAISWSFCSTSSRTGAELPPATTKPEIYTGFVNLAQSCSGYPLSTKLGEQHLKLQAPSIPRGIGRRVQLAWKPPLTGRCQIPCPDCRSPLRTD